VCCILAILHLFQITVFNIHAQRFMSTVCRRIPHNYPKNKTLPNSTLESLFYRNMFIRAVKSTKVHFVRNLWCAEADLFLKSELARLKISPLRGRMRLVSFQGTYKEMLFPAYIRFPIISLPLLHHSTKTTKSISRTTPQKYPS
jgi:hypothetical protein